MAGWNEIVLSYSLVEFMYPSLSLISHLLYTNHQHNHRISILNNHRATVGEVDIELFVVHVNHLFHIQTCTKVGATACHSQVELFPSTQGQ